MSFAEEPQDYLATCLNDAKVAADTCNDLSTSTIVTSAGTKIDPIPGESP